MSNNRMSRRKALSTAGKVAIGVVAAGLGSIALLFPLHATRSQIDPSGDDNYTSDNHDSYSYMDIDGILCSSASRLRKSCAYRWLWQIRSLN